MYWLITITRDDQKFYVVSPAFGEFALSPTKEKNTYLWSSRESAMNDSRWQHLIAQNDLVEYHRTYTC